MQIVQIGNGSIQRPSAETVGAKAAGLARMAAIGLPVPPAFVLPIELCAAIVRNDALARRQLSDGLATGIAFLEEATGKKFGDRRRPLLVSVRSGAARSMPGMLDTVLNVGCTLRATYGLVRMTGHPRFGWNCRRRFLESFASVVLGVDPALFARALAQTIAVEGVDSERKLDGEAVERLARVFQQGIDETDNAVPDDPMEQLAAAARSVYRSWNSARARTYRDLQHLDDLQGTAVTVQAMVFGNRGASSGAGVAFSRDPSTGGTQPVIEVLFDSQGEDVVSGSRTPETEHAMNRSAPTAAVQLRETLVQLEREFGDVQDVEFTIENGKLWILQTRSAKRTPQAALRFAIDFVKDGLITPLQALQRVSELDVSALAQKHLVSCGEPAARGTGASTGIAVGRAAFDSESAKRLGAGADPIILVRPDTSTADIEGFAVSHGIVTAVGGRTAHAALLARQMNKPCIVGCAGLDVDVENHCAQLLGARIKEGDWLSIDGAAGTIYLQRCNIAVDRPEADLAEIERWRTKLASARPAAQH
jgi:pyruvate,orthophosphate dikinase